MIGVMKHDQTQEIFFANLELQSLKDVLSIFILDIFNIFLISISISYQHIFVNPEPAE